MVFGKLESLSLKDPLRFSRLIGTLGPISSSSVQSYLKFSTNSHNIAISCKATANSLSNSSINFCRTIPDITAQVKVMIELIKHLQSNCVICLFSNTDFGTDGDSELLRLTTSHNITYSSKMISNTNLESVYSFVNSSKLNNCDTLFRHVNCSKLF